jgi:hypothetical protein
MHRKTRGKPTFFQETPAAAIDHRIAIFVPFIQPYGAASVSLFRICWFQAAPNGLQKELRP